MKSLCHGRSLAPLLLLSAACNSYPSGQHYTMAKVDRNGYLVPAHKALNGLPGAPTVAESSDDRDALVSGFLGLSLDWGFVRYLQAVSQPELAIFTRVHVHRPDDTSTPPGFVFQNVYMAGDGSNSQASIGKGTSVPRIDIGIMPALDYQGETITVEIRAVELDADDAERTKGLVNLAASVAAVSEPANAAAISTFQTVLNFVADSNRDDIEFSFDFQHAAQPPKSAYQGASDTIQYAHLPPRVATYVVIKTEDPRRVNLPDSYLGVAAEGVLWTVSTVLQGATLNLLNWDLPMIPERVGNPYKRIFGSPFAVATSSMLLPNWRSDGVLGANVDYAKSGSYGWFTRGESNRDYAPFVVTNKGLRVIHPDDFGGPGEACGDIPPEIYRDQTYFVISVSNRESGVSYAKLQKMAQAQKAVDDLGLRTGPQPLEEWKASLEQVRVKATAFALESLVSDLKSDLQKAKTDDERTALEKAAKEQIQSLVDDGFLPSSVQAIATAKIEANRKAFYAEKGAFAVTPEYMTIDAPEEPEADFILENRSGADVKNAFLVASDGAGQIEALESGNPDPKARLQQVKFGRNDLSGLASTSNHTLVVQTETGNSKGLPVILVKSPKVTEAEVHGDKIVLKGTNLTYASRLTVKSGDEVIPAKLVRGESHKEITLKFDDDTALAGEKLVMNLEYPVGIRPATSASQLTIWGKWVTNPKAVPTKLKAGTLISWKPDVTGESGTYSVEPSLPEGLSLNEETGEISGSAAGPAPERTYVVTFENDSFKLSRSIRFQVIPGA